MTPPAEETAAADSAGDTGESVYGQMKAQIARKREIQGNAKGGAGNGEKSTVVPEVPVVEDLADLAAVWTAARARMAAVSPMLESVLGDRCRLQALNVQTGETILVAPASQTNFTNERARLKLEEALHAVTRINIRLAVQFENDLPAAEGSRIGVTPAAMPASTTPAAAQRVPPEVVDAVKAQPVVQELMKRLDASVVQVELLNTGEADTAE